jgi:uncharacterized protein (TIGR02646 family)
MRPVDRGNTPLDLAGQPKIYRRYQQARDDLIDRLGEYCCYCGMELDSSLAVEHVKPKKLHPDLELSWENFLLGCTNCNSIKGAKEVDLDDFYWPDRDNTMLAFEFLEGGVVRPHPDLTPQQRARAEATIKLTGLDRVPGNDPEAKDRRWRNRREAWDMAVESLNDLRQIEDQQASESPPVRRITARLAYANGFWSVWMTVFRDDADMRQRLIEIFPGTCSDCFDDDFNPVHRPNGVI